MTEKHIYHVGAHVMYALATSEIEVEIVDENDPAWIGGVRLWKIRVCLMDAEPYEVWVGEDRIRPLTEATRPPPSEGVRQ